MAHMTIDEMAETRHRWPMLREIIRSEQIPAERLMQLLSEHPEFAAWYRTKGATNG